MSQLVTLTEEQQALRQMVRSFAEAASHEIQTAIRSSTFPDELVGKMGELGLFGLGVPEELGGSGGTFFDLCLAIEELGRVDQSLGITLEAGVGLGIAPLLHYGTDQQKQQWLPDLCAGRTLAAFGLTEPDGGSDVAGATRTRAVRDGDSWVLNGSKVFITNVGTPRTSICTVTAWTANQDSGGDEMTSIIVPVDTPGFTVAPPYEKVGWHASDTREVSLADVRVPVANTLGAQGDGLRQFLATLDDGRIAIAALATGLIQGCVDECVRYAQEREAFGKPIAKHQAIAFKIADLEVAAQASRVLWQTAARLRQAELPYKREACVAKLYSSEQAVTAAREAVQVFGGMGFMMESRVGRFYQDAKILEIGEGTSEVQRMLIARDLGL